jgi:hypothetical protein
LGIKPDTPFSVRFRANARELGGGSGRIIRTVETIDDEAKDDLEHQTFINAHYSRDDKVITGHVVVMGRHLKPEADEPFSILRNGQATNVSVRHMPSPMQYIALLPSGSTSRSNKRIATNPDRYMHES